ncbi:nicotinate-nucleotide adenylyltransferase [Opitutales bacterium ASA1]|uniref:nicotinate-nucleotide adenylyltransferase n=1 Tax=Congregicoccus parvus TaxID=3081749 RepID=UPI002B2BC186|nr:nicotinate-nucleotide adenylyltransferase [Opitutales bacterium ASA1]
MSETEASFRLGVFGGTFDPVHLGHLVAAQDAAEALELDRVLFMPAFRAPLKDREPGASDAVRVALLQAAIEGDERFGLSTLEIERGGVSYTVDTARELRRLHPEAQLFWIIGADQAERLRAWHRIEELAGLLEFIVLARPGYEGTRGGLPEFLRLHFVRAHVFDISSSEIRARLSNRRSVRVFLPAPVADRIERESLYR